MDSYVLERDINVHKLDIIPVYRDFLQNTFENLEYEINLAINNIFHNPRNLFFSSTEMSWLHMLNNSIIRQYGDKAQSAIELSLYENHIHKGRLDLIVAVELEGHKHTLLFEGKLSEFKAVKNWDFGGKYEASSQQEYNRIEKQLNYYASLIEDLNGTRVTKVAMGFQWMRSIDAVASAKEYMKIMKEDPFTQFCALYTIGEYGVWAYGKVYADSK